MTIKVAPRYTDANAMVARGEAQIAIQTVSEILNMPGVELAGTIPPSVQPPMVFAAAVVASSTQAANANRLIEFFSSDAIKAVLKKMEWSPLGHHSHRIHCRLLSPATLPGRDACYV